VRLASRGTREDDQGESHTIDDAALADALRRQARRIHVQSLLLALFATGVCLIIPL
jgi:hypothetical protein